MRWKTAFTITLVLASPLAALSQPVPKPPESITVTGVRPSEKVIDDFIFSHAVPSRALGKIARWKTPICPETMGLRSEYAKFVSRRIREVAARVGAPLNASPGCKPNIRAVFTTTPQELMDNLRLNKPLYLGYFQSRLQGAEMAKITRPIQSWYATETNDLRGNPVIDSNQATGLAMNYQGLAGTDSGGISVAPTAGQLNLDNATVHSVTGNRLNDGLSSTFFNVLIVGEPAKLLDHEIGTLADYIAMLALSDTGAPDKCSEFPTILNLLVPDCPRIATALTEGDFAYLKALYKMTPANTFRAQRGEMRYQMQQALK